MNTAPARILLADDEETFLLSTADLFRDQGYECDVVSDTPSALALLEERPYDLVVADIRMPGNPELTLPKAMMERHHGLPVILVTGYPSLETAVSAIQLPVVAYLVKPLDFDELLRQAARAINGFRAARAMATAEERADLWQRELAQFNDLVTPGTDATSPAVARFIDAALRNVVGTMRDLSQLTGALPAPGGEGAACNLLNCPRHRRLTSTLEATVAVLEETKSAFKSKQLADLRRRLEFVLHEEGR